MSTNSFLRPLSSRVANKANRKSSTDPLLVLVTGFYDWTEPDARVPVGNNKDIQINPSGYLIEGTYPGHLTSLLKTVTTDENGRTIEWSFKCLRVSKNDVKSAGLEKYDIVVGLGLGNYDNDSELFLEKGALNEFSGWDEDEYLQLYHNVNDAVSNVAVSVTCLNMIDTQLNKILQQLDALTLQLDFTGASINLARARLRKHIQALVKHSQTAQSMSMFAKRRSDQFKQDWRGQDSAKKAEEACLQAGTAIAAIQKDANELTDLHIPEFEVTLVKADKAHPSRQAATALADFVSTTMGSLTKEFAKALNSMNLAENFCSLASQIIVAGADHAIDPSRKRTDSLPPSKFSLSGATTYGAYTLAPQAPDPKNDYVCNAMHYHGLGLVQNRNVLKIRLSEMYFIHLPFAKMSSKWAASKKSNSGYAKLSAAVMSEKEGYTLMAKAVAELITDLVT